MSSSSNGSYSRLARAGAGATLAAFILVGFSLTPASAQGRRGPKKGIQHADSRGGHGSARHKGARGARALPNLPARAPYANGRYPTGNVQSHNRPGHGASSRGGGHHSGTRHNGYYPPANGGYYPQGNGGSYPRGNGSYYPPSNGGYYPQAGGNYGNNPYGGGTYGSAGAYPNDPRYYSDRRGNKSREDVSRRAAQVGYNDGQQRGQYDRAQGTRRGNPQGHGAFQHGLNGFDPSWGYALTYQQTYRQYFEQGYFAGFGQSGYGGGTRQRSRRF